MPPNLIAFSRFPTQLARFYFLGPVFLKCVIPAQFEVVFEFNFCCVTFMFTSNSILKLKWSSSFEFDLELEVQQQFQVRLGPEVKSLAAYALITNTSADGTVAPTYPTR
mmetsp:Transcript_42080/g.51033  ORF Transcript_42080/g.51033 Transcript_42080/m.51033 type:complete len:109 (-) Transcript_42080:977-1303(-)